MEKLSASGYFQFVSDGASEEIKNKTLDKEGVRCYIRHLPIKGDPNYDGWGEEVLSISDKCLHELWKYSKEMCYIDKSAPYEVFVKREF